MASREGLRRPKQDRSRKTVERVLDALEEMLKEAPFESISVRALLQRSQTSAGSFYARFPTKAALLPVLYDRHDSSLHARQWEPKADPGTFASLEEVVTDMTERLVRRHRERRWFVSAVALHARQHPELIPEKQRARRRTLHQSWHEGILRFRDRIGHPDPERAVAFGLFMVVTTCREKIVFSEAPLATSFDMSDEHLAEELARAFLAYLAVTRSTGRGD